MELRINNRAKLWPQALFARHKALDKACNYFTEQLPLPLVSVSKSIAALHVPDPHAERGAMIAGTAIAYKFTIVTRHLADIADAGVSLVNLWLT